MGICLLDRYNGELSSFSGGIKWFQKYCPQICGKKTVMNPMGSESVKHHPTKQDMGVSKNSGTPKSSIKKLGFPLFSPSILGHPYFRKHPYHSLGGETCWQLLLPFGVRTYGPSTPRCVRIGLFFHLRYTSGQFIINP